MHFFLTIRIYEAIEYLIIPDNDTESDSLKCLALSPISKLEAFIFAVAVELVTVEAEDPHRSGSVVERLLGLSIHKKYLIEMPT